jgi:hypothetical protein
MFGFHLTDHAAKEAREDNIGIVEIGLVLMLGSWYPAQYKRMKVMVDPQSADSMRMKEFYFPALDRIVLIIEPENKIVVTCYAKTLQPQ